RSASSADPSVLQLDHDLSTPRTDELSLGVEGALGDSWSIGLAFIRRQARGLLQDADLNHFTCLDAKEAIGIDPAALCPDINGVPDPDRIGAVPGGFPFPNGVEDLYTASALFNQVLRVENSNDSDYSAWELTLVRAQRANWQMKAGYTLSRARGQAATELSIVADDPSTAGAEYGYLDYDQRHRVKVQAVASLPRRLVLSGAVRWESGAPYSVFEIVSGDFDSSGNSLTRTLYPTGRRNDQRNESAWKLDARVEKGFRIGRVSAAGFLLAENLLNDDTLQLRTVSESGEILNGRRDFGRRFEIGALFGF
ncbi:MAG TPA: hypothetical protein VFP98_09420, partial [Candidatus Polarisedimenticolia bacterium]|nr:hypothetical protein [Candidatus Polarisedimenticolia bacterium]